MIAALRKTLPVLGLALALPLAAAPPSELVWEASVEEAAAGNPELRAARAEVTAAGHSASAARSGNLPSLTAGAGYSDSSGSAITGGSRNAEKISLAVITTGPAIDCDRPEAVSDT